jgi:hypothetical protein
MITQKDMMCAYPHKVPRYEEDYLHSKYNLLENYISIPTSLTGHLKRFKESLLAANSTIVSPPLLLSQYPNVKSVVGKVGQLGRAFRKKEGIGKTTLSNAETLGVPLQSRPGSCKPSLNRKNLRRALKRKPSSGTSSKETEGNILITEMGKLEVENVTINRINESENIDAMEDINLQGNYSGNDTSFYKDVSGPPVLEAKVREHQAKRALENNADVDLVVDFKDKYADSYQTPNIAGTSEMEDLSPEYTYEGQHVI